MAALSDATIELLLSGVWTSIKSDVVRPGISITRGLQDEADHASPAQCQLRVNNRFGKYSPRNPVGPLYGKIGRNTPIRVGLNNTGIDDGPVFDSSSKVGATSTGNLSWNHSPNPGSAVSGVLVFVVQNIGITDEVLSVTYDGVPLTEVPNSPVIHSTGLEDGVLYAFFLGENIPSTKTSVPILVTVNATGSVKDAACYTVTSNSLKTEVDVVATLDSGGVADPSVNLVTTRKTFIAAALHSGQDAIGSVTTGTGYTRISVGTDFGAQVCDYVRRTATPQPTPPGTIAVNWTSTIEEAGIIAVAIRDSLTYPRFYGEVSDWPQEWTHVELTSCPPTGTPFNDAGVPMTAQGILRRLGQGQTPLKSAVERYSVLTNAWIYWPLNDLTRATLGEPAIGDNRFTLRRKGSSLVQPGNGELAPWMSNGVLLRAGATVTSVSEGVVAMSPAVTVNHWAVDWAMRYDATEQEVTSMSVYDLSGEIIWRVRYVPTTTTVEVRLRTGGEGSTESVISSLSHPTSFDGELHAFRLDATQSGGNISYTVYVDGVAIIGPTTSGSTSLNQTGISKVRITGGAGNTSAASVWGHVAVWGDDGDTHSVPAALSYFQALNGWLGEDAAQRILRLCNEESIVCRLDVTGVSGTMMGPQFEATLLELLQDAETTDTGILYEPREFLGLAYRSRAAMANQPVMATIDHNTQCGIEVRPTDDDQQTKNLIKVNRKDGSSFTIGQFTGPLSVLPPPSGVGVYDEEVTVNVFGDGKPIEDEAGWLLHLGTVDEARFPDIVLTLGYRGGPCAAADSPVLAQLDVGERFLITNIPQWLLPDDADQLARGFIEGIGTGTHKLGMNATPASPYNMMIYSPAVTGGIYKLDTAGSVLAAAATDTATTMQIATDLVLGPPWVTNDAEFPFDLRMSGERLTVTDILPPAAQTFVTGTGAHADNAPVTPGLPANQADDLLFIFAAIRNTSFQPIAPAGYVRVPVFLATDNCQLFGKVATSSESAPTVTFTGGAAGDTCSARMFRFRGGLWYDLTKIVLAASRSTNPVSTDMQLGDVSVDLNDCLVLALGWKQDDWTSVATLTGFTEVFEETTIIGNDQSLVVDRTFMSSGGQIDVTTGVDRFVVTGGLGAISKTVIAVLHEDRQQFTVTRAVNGVRKAQTVGTPTSLWSPMVFGL
jgi:hypothetical protein